MQGSVNGLIEECRSSSKPRSRQGTFLRQETQSLARRVDGLDERLWARTSGRGPRMTPGRPVFGFRRLQKNVPRSEASKQRNREIEQQAAPSFLFVTSPGWGCAASACQVQAMEQQNRLAAAAAEEFLHDFSCFPCFALQGKFRRITNPRSTSCPATNRLHATILPFIVPCSFGRIYVLST